jgi:hypothetical protein
MLMKLYRHDGCLQKCIPVPVGIIVGVKEVTYTSLPDDILTQLAGVTSTDDVKRYVTWRMR